MRFVSCLVFLLLSIPAFADDPVIPEPVPVKPGLIFPSFPGVDPVTPSPAPVPVPAVDSIPVLSAGQWYVVQSDAEFYLLASPADRVVIQYEQGPLRIKGVFADGSGKVETRTYASKYLAIVDAAESKSGRVELFGIPAGVSDPSLITRRLIDIGVAPQPPPIDPPVPPGPPPVVVPTGFRVLMIYESSDSNPEAVNTTLNSTKIRAYLNSKCVKGADGTPEWRVWDKDITVSANESPTMKLLWDGVKPTLGTVPRLVVAVNGAAKVYPLPATEVDTLAFLKTIGGE